MHRYSNIDYVMNLDVEEGLEIVKTAYDKHNEEILFQRWNIEHLFMDKPQSFDEYKKQFYKVDNTNTNLKTKEEIIKEAEEIKKLDQSQRKRGGINAIISDIR